ncbi:MAG: AAA family ATPase [Bernardetiaceae bacterium]|nr:AAA family ATPase [Bernardetiaceae bacterium]
MSTNTNFNNSHKQANQKAQETRLGRYNVFGEGYFSEMFYMLNRFDQKPIELSMSEYCESNLQVDLNKFIEKLEKADFAPLKLYKRYTSFNKKEGRYSIDWYLFLRDERIVINVDSDSVKKLDKVRFALHNITAIEDETQEDLMQIFEIAQKCLVETEDDQKRYISIVGNTPRIGLTLRKHEIKAPHIPDLNLYYGQDFDKKHETIVELINQRNSSGLFIFHGLTGSGKTNYIRYLISSAKPEIEFIFYPISLLRDIASPDFITFLSDYQDAVLIIEESEDSVQARDKFNADKSAIANLLNVSDGLLSDVLNLKIICTFNTDIRNLDQALLREGRLLAIHKFDKLSVENANEIAKVNKLKKKFEKPVSLAQIFNKKLNEDLSDFKEGTGRIGFGS